MTIHVRTWTGGCSARITDMTNAGKRGKKCAVLRFNGVQWGHGVGTEDQQRAKEVSTQIFDCIAKLLDASPTCDFATAAGIVEAMVADARSQGIPESYIGLYREEIRGIDAPVEPLEAKGDGWHATADENGVTVDDTRDQFNEPCMITTRQKNSQAYRIARKVWDRVMKAASFHEAGDILRDAGCKLHYYCRMD